MAVSLLLFFLLIPLALVVLGVGGYALYEGFAKEEADKVWLGSPQTARIVGIIAVLGGLLLLCGLVLAVFYIFGVRIVP
ncbi:MAG: hypothetical protein JXA33_18310 [Anaerolineae bacterium]|nr:hypothetical protein [Anaerolineae bacterium]